MRFDDPRMRLQPQEVGDIRRRSAVSQEDVMEYERDHFMRMI
ncbi:hypothetical protein [Rhizobium mesosinicum]